MNLRAIIRFSGLALLVAAADCKNGVTPPSPPPPPPPGAPVVRAGKDSTVQVGATFTLSATFTDKSATATVTGESIGLAAGNVFRIDNCLQEHVGNTTYTLSCNSKSQNTLANTASVYVGVVSVAAEVASLGAVAGQAPPDIGAR